MRRITFLVLCAWGPPVQGDDLPLAVIESAHRREARLKVVSVSWKVTTFVPKGGRMNADPVGLPLPRADVTVESTHRLVLDGVRFRVEHNDPGLRQHVPSEGDGVAMYDGAVVYRRTYMDGRDRPALLTIERPTQTPAFGTGWLLPLSFWCRGSSLKPSTIGPGDSRTVGEVEHERTPHLAVSIATSAAESRLYLLDPWREYLARRVTVTTSAGVEATDVEYREQPGAGWIPAGWTTVKSRADGKLAYRIRAEVTDVRASEPIAPGAFQFDLIPGERVFDHRGNKLYQVGADGTLEELDRNGAPVVVPEPPRRPAPVWPGRTLVRFVLLPALLVAVLAAVVLRRRRPPYTPSP